MRYIFKKSLHIFSCFLILFYQIAPTYAQIAVDTAAPVTNQAGLSSAPNGVDVINIVTPNASGLSHNKFTDYNVPSTGVILNNSAGIGVSSLGGAMIGNSNITSGSEASTILNEVTSGNPSVLEGATEVFGAAADVIVANPNGITCRGCGFLNTPTSTLTTGTPTIDGSGALTNLSINDGAITIEGTGLNNAGNKAKILSRAIAVNADIQAGEIEIVSGRNDYDTTTGIATPKADDGSIKPSFAIDSSALGGMYADKITLRGTESGVGFRLAGDMAASVNDLMITNDGRIEMKNASAGRDIEVITSGAHDIDIDGAITSTAETSVNSSNNITLTSNATIESRGTSTQLTATDTITNNGGAVVGYQGMTINAANLVNQEGIFIGRDDVTIQGLANGTNMTVLDNLAGSIESTNGNILILADTLNNVSDVQTETQTTSFWFRFKESSIPGYIPHGQDLTNEAWALFHYPDHAMAINPYLIDDVLADHGRTRDEYYDAVNDRYVFEVADWQALAPQNNAEWRAILNAGLTEKDKKWSIFVQGGTGLNSGGNWYYIAQLVEDKIVDGTTAKIAGITAQAGNLTITGDTINNDRGFLSAANDIELNGNDLNLTALELNERLVQRVNYGNGDILRESGWGTWLGFTNSITRFTEVVGSVPATIAAGNDVNGTLSGDVTAVSSPVTQLNDFDFGGNSHGVLRSTLQTGNTQSPLFLNSGLIQPANNDNFLFETRVSFTDLGTFYGSDYFITGVLGAGYDPNAITRRLGDAYIDSRYINEQVLASGRKFLDASFNTDTDQVKALLDRGIAAQSALALTPFIALTEAQQAALTQDIVWYEEREINGEMILVPQLYLAKATLDETGTKIRGGTISAGGNVQLAAANVNVANTRINAGGDIQVTATDSIVSSSGIIDGNNIELDAGNDIIVTTQTETFGNGQTHYGTRQGLKGGLYANGQLDLTGGDLVAFIGADAQSGGDTNINAQDFLADALSLQGGSNITHGRSHSYYHAQAHTGSDISSDADLNINTTNSVRLRGSAMNAQNDLNVTALAGDITVDSVQNEYVYHTNKGKKTSHDIQKTTNIGSSLNTQNGDVNIKTTLGNVTLESAEIDSGNDINVEATTGSVNITATKDRDYESRFSSKSSALWQKTVNKGHEHESVKHTILTGEGDLNITAANGVTIEYRATGNLENDIAQLSQAPGLAWMADLKDDPNVDWQGITEIHREWYEKQEGLGGPAAAIIAIAVVIVTQQYQLGAMLAGTGASTTAIAAANAGVASLLSQATIAAISNKGNLGDAFQDLATSDAVRSVAAAALTAGLLEGAGVADLTNNSLDFFAEEAVIGNLQDQLLAAGIRAGVDSTVGGGNFNESLINNLRFAGAAVVGAQLSQNIGQAFDSGDIDRTAQLIAHAATGCAAGAVGTGNCGAGAAGQLAGEIASILHGEATVDDIDDLTQDWSAQNIDTARIAGALASALAGGSADDVSQGSELAGTAAANNGILTLIAKACGKVNSCKTRVVQQTSKLFSKNITVDDLLKGSAKIGKNKFDKSGGFKQANKDFDALKLKDVKTINTQYGPGRTGKLPDGTNVSVRPGSSGGKPTIEIGSRAGGIKIRFNE